jgi:hypothetical protein
MQGKSGFFDCDTFGFDICCHIPSLHGEN